MNAYFEKPIPVRFADCDMLGHLNHAKMFTYMEETRAAYLMQLPRLGFSANFNEIDLSVILAEVSCVYKSPAYFGETILVRVRVSEMKRSSFVMDYEMLDHKTSRLVALGRTVGVLFDYKNQKSVPFPDEVKQKIEEIEQRKF